MPKCQKCYKYYPPHFSEIIEGTEDHECIFCKDNINFIMYDDEDGKRKKYTKERCERDYKKYLNMVKEKNDSLIRKKRLTLKE